MRNTPPRLWHLNIWPPDGMVALLEEVMRRWRVLGERLPWKWAFSVESLLVLLQVSFRHHAIEGVSSQLPLPVSTSPVHHGLLALGSHKPKPNSPMSSVLSPKHSTN